jgi:hypothetical protein
MFFLNIIIFKQLNSVHVRTSHSHQMLSFHRNQRFLFQTYKTLKFAIATNSNSPPALSDEQASVGEKLLSFCRDAELLDLDVDGGFHLSQRAPGL